MSNEVLENMGYKIETTAGTKKVTAAGDTTTAFGLWVKDGKDELPCQTNKIDVAYVYNSREAASKISIIDPSSLSLDLQNIIPTETELWALLLGQASGTPNVASVKDTGLKSSVTVHGENNNGTNPFTRDLVGAYLTNMKWNIEVAKPLTIESIHFDGFGIEDEDSSVPSIFLTNPPSIANYNIFEGISEIKWDIAGDNETLLNVYRVDFESGHNIITTKVVGSGSNATRKVYPGKFGSRSNTGHKFFMSAILDTHNQYDDLRDGNEVNVSFKTLKPVDGKYITFTCTGVHIIEMTGGIPRGGGYEERMITCEYRNLTVTDDL